MSITGDYEWRSRRFNAHLSGDQINIAPVRASGTDPLPIAGDVSFDLDLSGDVMNPQGTGNVLIRNVSVDSMDIGGFRLDLALQDTTVAVSMASDADDLVLTGKVRLTEKYAYDAMLRLNHYGLNEYMAPAGGFISGELSARGELAEAEGSEALLLIDTLFLTYDQERVQNLDPIIVRLQERSIDIEKSELSISGQRISFGGSVALDQRSGRIDLWARSSMIDLARVAQFLPDNPLIGGVIALDIRLLRTERSMDIDGLLSLSGGRYETDHVVVDSVDGRVGFRDGVLTIETLRGRMNGGRFGVGGFAGLARGSLDTLFLTGDLRGAVFADKSFGRAAMSAQMALSGKKDSLRIDGEITVEEGIYDAPIRLQSVIGMLTAANRPVPERSDMLKRIYCDVGISVPDSFRILNNVADLRAKADLEVKGYLARPNAYGTIMAVGEGSVQYLGRKFTIVNAVIQFDDPYKIDPIIDLAAMASVSAADGEYDIYLLLNGTATTWQLRLSANPPVPEQDIISLLLIGQRRPGDVTGLAGDVDLKAKAKDYALDAVRLGLEKKTQDLLHLDKFTLSGDLSDPTTVRVGIEKSVAKGFRLIYTTGVESWELHQMGAVYDLTDHISIFTLHDQENLNTSADLDFHLEIR